MRNSGLSLQEITSLDDFQSIQKEWNAFLNEAGQESIFFQHEWFEFCWRRIEKEAKPWIWIARDGHRIIAIAPLMLQRARLRGLPIRKILFLENPDTPVADFVAGDERREGIEAILDGLIRHRRYWDLIFLNKIPGDSETLSILERASQDRCFKLQSDRLGRRSFLKKITDWETYWRNKSPKFRKTMRNVLNRLEKLGKVVVEHHQHLDDLDQVINEVFSVSGKSWKVKIGMAITSQESVRMFFCNLSNLAQREGWLNIWLLKLNGQPIAMEYDLVDQRKVWAIRADFDEAFEGYSPGSYLNYVITKHFFESDSLEYDMGPGINEYKLRWTNQFHQVAACRIYSRTMYGSGLFYLENRLIPVLRVARRKYLEIIRKKEEDPKASEMEIPGG